MHLRRERYGGLFLSTRMSDLGMLDRRWWERARVSERERERRRGVWISGGLSKLYNTIHTYKLLG